MTACSNRSAAGPLGSVPLVAVLLAASLPAAAYGPAEEDNRALHRRSRESDDSMRREQSITVEGESPLAPSTSSIATRLSVSRADTPLAIGVVSEELIREQGATILGDVLPNVSGVAVHTGNGVHDYFVIRGVDSLTGGLVMVDNLSEPEATFYNLYNVDRVEVIKGPAGFLYGGNTLVGAVDLVRKRPLDSDFAELYAGGGRFGSWSTGIDVNVAANDRVAFRVNGLWQETDGYRDDRDGRTWAVNPVVRFALGQRTNLTVAAEAAENRYHPDAGLPVLGDQLADGPRERSYASPFDASEQDIARIRIDLVTPLNDRVTIQNKAYLTSLDWRTKGTLLSGVFPNASGGLDVQRALFELDDLQTVVGNRLEALVKLGDGTHQLVAGVDLQRQRDDFTLGASFLPAIDLTNPVETAQMPLFPLPGQDQRGDTKTIVAAPYLLDRIQLHDDFDLWLGARLDHVDYEDDATASDRTDTELSPMVGMTYRATPVVTLYGNAGRSFAPPSTRVVGERRPEKSRQAELGVRCQLFDGRLRAGVAGYHLERDDIAIPDATGVTRQTGSQRSRGVELDLSGRIAGLDVLANYAYSRATFTEMRELVIVGLDPFLVDIIDREGNRAAFAPDNLFRVWLARPFASGLTVGAGARYVGGQFIAADNRYEIDSYVTLDAGVTYRNRDVELQLNLDNITDEDYETRGFGNSSVIPGEPFTASVRAAYRF